MKRYKVPDWLRKNKKAVFTPEEENRILLNAGRIPVADLAILMHCHEKRIRHWAEHRGVTVAIHKRRYPKDRKPPAKAACSMRMMELAERLTT